MYIKLISGVFLCLSAVLEMPLWMNAASWRLCTSAACEYI